MQKIPRNSAEFRGIPYVFKKIPYSVGSQKRTSVDTLAATFKIVDIEDRGNLIFPPSGDDNSAHPAMQSGDADSAKASEDNSAKVVSRSARDAGSAIQTRNQSDSGSENNATPATAPGSSIPKSSSKKVPAMVKPPKIFAPPRIPAEADATPSSTYRSILEAKKQKACPPPFPAQVAIM